MDFKETIKIILQRKWLVFWMAVLGAVLFFDLMVIQTPDYEASSKILVIQKQTNGQDIYTVSKSAQRLAQILREAIYSDSFFEKVLESPYEIEVINFSADPEKRRKEWKKTVNVTIGRDLGLMEIDISYPRQEKAEQISRAITSALKQNHQLYHGAGDNIEMRILDYPLVDKKPNSLRLWLGTLLGAIVGFLAGAVIAFRKSLTKDNNNANLTPVNLLMG